MRSRGVVDERWLRYALLDMQVECFQSDIATWSLELSNRTGVSRMHGKAAKTSDTRGLKVGGGVVEG